jgi:hypothetical protein
LGTNGDWKSTLSQSASDTFDKLPIPLRTAVFLIFLPVAVDVSLLWVAGGSGWTHWPFVVVFCAVSALFILPLGLVIYTAVPAFVSRRPLGAVGRAAAGDTMFSKQAVLVGLRLGRHSATCGAMEVSDGGDQPLPEKKAIREIVGSRTISFQPMASQPERWLQVLSTASFQYPLVATRSTHPS